MKIARFRRIAGWIVRTWPRRSKGRNPIEDLHAFFSERLTESGKALALLWLVSLAPAAMPGWNASKLPFLLLSAVLAVSLAATWRRPRLAAAFLGADLAREGEETGLRFQLRNEGARSVRLGGVGLFRPREGLDPREAVGHVASIEPGGRVDLLLRVRCLSRGPTGYPGLAVLRLDPFGVARARRFSAPAIDLAVAPASMRVKPARFLFADGSGAEFARAVGLGGDRERIFSGVRAFREGDRLRDLDHKAWARWNQPVVREFASAPEKGIAVSVCTGCESLLERALLEPMLRLACACTIDFRGRGWLSALWIDGREIDGATESDQVILSEFGRIPRCGWGAWPRVDSATNVASVPLLEFRVSSPSPSIREPRGAIKRVEVVDGIRLQGSDPDLLQVAAAAVESGEVAL